MKSLINIVGKIVDKSKNTIAGASMLAMAACQTVAERPLLENPTLHSGNYQIAGNVIVEQTLQWYKIENANLHSDPIFFADIKGGFTYNIQNGAIGILVAEDKVPESVKNNVSNFPAQGNPFGKIVLGQKVFSKEGPYVIRGGKDYWGIYQR